MYVFFLLAGDKAASVCAVSLEFLQHFVEALPPAERYTITTSEVVRKYVIPRTQRHACRQVHLRANKCGSVVAYQMTPEDEMSSSN